MSNDDVLLLKGQDIATLLDGRELEIVEAVGRAYKVHAEEKSSLPHSTFLRFPDNEKDRIIALPHPRFVMQYQLRNKAAYIGQYLAAFQQIG